MINILPKTSYFLTSNFSIFLISFLLKFLVSSLFSRILVLLAKILTVDKQLIYTVPQISYWHGFVIVEQLKIKNWSRPSRIVKRLLFFSNVRKLFRTKHITAKNLLKILRYQWTIIIKYEVFHIKIANYSFSVWIAAIKLKEDYIFKMIHSFKLNVSSRRYINVIFEANSFL